MSASRISSFAAIKAKIADDAFLQLVKCNQDQA